MRACRAAVLAAGLAGSALAGCNRDQGEGYLEIKTIPVSPQTPAALVLDAAKLDPVKKGQAILRAKVGPHKLHIEGPGGQLALLCDLLVKKDRITTVTVSVLDRPPRCVCRNSASTDAPANRTCVS